MKRILAWCSLLSLFALHTAVRLRPASQVFGSSETEPLFAGADSFCHAHRIRLLFEQSPRFVFHDRFMFHPQGTIMEWPLGFDWGVATVLRTFTSSWETAVWWLPWTSVAISLVALAVFLGLARSVLTRGVALLLAGCFALNLAFSRVSTLAELDHHVVETLCLALLLWIPIVAPGWSRRQAIAFGLTLAWSMWNSTLLAFVVFGWLVLWLLALQVRRTPMPMLRDFALALLSPLVVVSAVEAHARSAYFAFNTLSLLHPLLIATALVGLFASSRISPAKLWGVVAVLVALSVVVAPGVIPWIGNFVTARDPVIGNINESRPLFSSLDGFTWTYAHAFFGPAYVLFPVAWLMLVRAHARDAKSSAGVSLALPLPLPTLALALALFALSLAQKRFAHLFVPGLVFVIGVWAARLPRPKVVLAVVALLLIEPAIVFFPDTAHAIPDNARLALRVAHVLRDGAAGRDDLGVSAPPNFGSAINYAARLPVVTSAFFYPRYLQADLAVRSFEATSDLLAYLRQQRLGYLVAVDDARYRTMLLKMLHQPELATHAAAWEHTPCSGALLRYAYDRIACGVERPDALIPLMHEHTSNDPTRLWRQLRVFRVLDLSLP